MRHIIKEAMVTEKSTRYRQDGVYVFKVVQDANKTEIAKEVEIKFKVKVESVRTVIGRGKPKMTRFGRGKTPYWKKAYVKLSPGGKIALFEGA